VAISRQNDRRVIPLGTPAGDGRTGDAPPDDAPSTDDHSDREHRIQVDASSETTVPFTVTVFGVSGPVESVRITYADGSQRTFAVNASDRNDASGRNGANASDRNGGLPSGALDGAVALVPLASVDGEASHTDHSPSTGVGLWLPTTGDGLVYVVTQSDRIVGWDAVTCADGYVTLVEVRLTDDGAYTRLSNCYY
jgi:hypothetical protein